MWPQPHPRAQGQRPLLRVVNHQASRTRRWHDLERWGQDHPTKVDAALVSAPAVLAALSVAMVSAVADLTFLAVVSFSMVAALALRRSRPVLSVAAVFGLALLHYVAGARLLPADAAVLVALYSAAAHAPPWARRLSLGAGLAGAGLQGLNVVLNRAVSGDQPTTSLTGSVISNMIGIAALVLVAWTAGQWRRTRVAYIGSLLERAHQAELGREQQVQFAAVAERARIARELHDIVAHSLSVIISQADGGRYAAAQSPAAAVQALETVATTGRAALRDMRGLLGVLGDGGVELTPQPNTADLPELVAAVTASGLPVTFTSTGRQQELDGGAALAIYRTVQEALTNTLKHAGPQAGARVQLNWFPAELEILVDDDGQKTQLADGSGRGLTGMRQRLSAYGGSVEAGPLPGQGYLVHATLPLPPVPTPEDPR